MIPGKLTIKSFHHLADVSAMRHFVDAAIK